MSERLGLEAFDCAPGLRLQAHERVSGLQIEGVTRRLEQLEAELDRLERRLWLTVYGVVAMILAQGFQSLIQV